MSAITTITRMWLTRSMKPFTFTDASDKELSYTNADNLGLYVHIPFCSSLCCFCPYCKELYHAERLDKYVDALLCEIEMIGSQSKQKKQVTSLYFGGGTPALAVARIGEIIQKLQEYFIINDGIGVELHPDNVTADILNQLKSAGVTKISIGIQSFQDEFLSVLGRSKTDYSELFAAINEVRFDTVSMDFIFALPGQTFELIRKDIDTAFLNGANHIAIYPFIDFAFVNSQIAKMEKREKHQLLDDITDYCQAKGYVRDSIWTFARETQRQYSSMTRENFLGFGCSATTLLREQFKINTFSVDAYIDQIHKDKIPTSLTIQFTKRQRMVYYLFWTAYSTQVDPEDFELFFGEKLSKFYGFEFWIACLLGFATKKNGVYQLTSKGAFYYHYYENFYTLSYIDKMWGLMKNEAFPKRLKF